MKRKTKERFHLTIIRRRRSEYCGIIPETKSRGFFHKFAELEENNCFRIIAQVIIRANAFSFFYSPETSKNSAVAILKISASVLQSPRAR